MVGHCGHCLIMGDTCNLRNNIVCDPHVLIMPGKRLQSCKQFFCISTPVTLLTRGWMKLSNQEFNLSFRKPSLQLWDGKMEGKYPYAS